MQGALKIEKKIRIAMQITLFVLLFTFYATIDVLYELVSSFEFDFDKNWFVVIFCGVDEPISKITLIALCGAAFYTSFFFLY